MKTQAKSTFKIKSWEEKPFSTVEGGPKLTKANSVMTYNGDLSGEGVVEELRIYPAEKKASIYAIQRFSGKIGNKSGSFVMEHIGRFENGVVTLKLIIFPNSGTGELKGITGEANFSSPQAEQYTLTLNYSLQ